MGRTGSGGRATSGSRAVERGACREWRPRGWRGTSGVPGAGCVLVGSLRPRCPRGPGRGQPPRVRPASRARVAGLASPHERGWEDLGSALCALEPVSAHFELGGTTGQRRVDRSEVSAPIVPVRLCTPRPPLPGDPFHWERESVWPSPWFLHLPGFLGESHLLAKSTGFRVGGSWVHLSNMCPSANDGIRFSHSLNVGSKSDCLVQLLRTK